MNGPLYRRQREARARWWADTLLGGLALMALAALLMALAFWYFRVPRVDPTKYGVPQVEAEGW